MVTAAGFGTSGALLLGATGPNDVEGSFVKGFDLKTDEGRTIVALPARPAICNDLVLGPDGSLYVSNTAQP